MFPTRCRPTSSRLTAICKPLFAKSAKSDESSRGFIAIPNIGKAGLSNEINELRVLCYNITSRVTRHLERFLATKFAKSDETERYSAESVDYLPRSSVTWRQSAIAGGTHSQSRIVAVPKRQMPIGCRAGPLKACQICRNSVGPRNGR